MPNQAKPIVLRQLVAVVRLALGVEVRHGRIYRVARDLATEGQIPPESYQDDQYLPDDVDRVVGGVRRLAAGWSQRRNVSGDFWGWVDMAGSWRLMMLPYARSWRQATKIEENTIPDSITCWEWPTARVSGVLTKVGMRHGYPAYKWEETYPERDDAEAIAESLRGERSSPRGPGKVLRGA